MKFKILFRLDNRYNYGSFKNNLYCDNYNEIINLIDLGGERAIEEYDPLEDQDKPEKMKQLLSDQSLTRYNINIDVTENYRYYKEYPDHKFYYNLDFYIDKDNIIKGAIFRDQSNSHYLLSIQIISYIQSSFLKLQYLLEDACDEYGIPLIAQHLK